MAQRPYRVISFPGAGFDTVMQMGVVHALLVTRRKAPDMVGGVSVGAITATALGEVLQANAGGIGLRSGATSTGTLVDAVAYGAVAAGFPFTETTAAAALVNGKSVARTFDGNDTNANAADLALVAAPTPRGSN